MVENIKSLCNVLIFERANANINDKGNRHMCSLYEREHPIVKPISLIVPVGELFFPARGMEGGEGQTAGVEGSVPQENHARLKTMIKERGKHEEFQEVRKQTRCSRPSQCGHGVVHGSHESGQS